MNNNNLIKKQAKMAAYIIGIATFLGFSVLMFMPSVYLNPFSVYLILGYLTFVPVGLLESYLFGLATYFLFKYTIKSKLVYWFVVAIGIVICFPIGAASNIYIFRQLAKTPPYKNEIDTNRDGKIDKWVYHDNTSTIVEIDTDYDGKPDTREHYDNGELVKKEIIPHPDKK